MVLWVGLLGWTAAALAAAGVRPLGSHSVPLDAQPRVDVAPAADLRRASPPSTPPPPAPASKQPRPAPPAPRAAVVEPATQPCVRPIELAFAPGAANAGHDDTEVFRRFVSEAGEWSEKKIVVEGYASASGSSDVNLRLSHDRAMRAKRRLIAAGVERERITVQAFGEYRPNTSGDTNRDRRVVIRLDGVVECKDGEGGLNRAAD